MNALTRTGAELRQADPEGMILALEDCYRVPTSVFVRFLRENGLGIDAEGIAAFSAYLREEHDGERLAARTVNYYLSAVKNRVRYLLDQGNVAETTRAAVEHVLGELKAEKVASSSVSAEKCLTYEEVGKVIERARAVKSPGGAHCRVSGRGRDAHLGNASHSQQRREGNGRTVPDPHARQGREGPQGVHPCRAVLPDPRGVPRAQVLVRACQHATALLQKLRFHDAAANRIEGNRQGDQRACVSSLMGHGHAQEKPGGPGSDQPVPRTLSGEHDGEHLLAWRVLGLGHSCEGAADRRDGVVLAGREKGAAQPAPVCDFTGGTSRG